MTTITQPHRNTFGTTLSDSVTMLRRQFLHMLRYPALTAIVVGMPVVFLLLFVYVFGGTLGAGLGTSGMSGGYVEYVVPGILIITITAGVQGTAISVAMDMTEGIVARFRTMAISRAAVLTGHVLGSVVQILLAIGLVTAVALLVGFRSTANVGEWILAIGLLAMIAFALTWLSVALGMVSKSVETASNLPMPLLILPLLGSGFVPTASMPAWLQWFAQYQPFTPFIETLRGLLLGTPIGANGLISIAWCVVITVGGYVWARALYLRTSTRAAAA